MSRFEELVPGQEREALSFLERDPVRNLRIIWALRTWGLFNIGLPEQGSYLAFYQGESMAGLLFRNNLGVWRLTASGEMAGALGERAVYRWGRPSLLVGPEEDVVMVLGSLWDLSDAVEHEERELSMLLAGEGLLTERSKAVLAGEEDMDDLVRLERMLQTELLGSCADNWVMRLQMLRAIEEKGAALVRAWGKAVAKAEIEAATPQADELGGVYTLPKRRGRGYARAACVLLCEDSLRRGKKIRLETQRDNHAAVRFYEGLGFRVLWPHLAVRFKG